MRPNTGLHNILLRQIAASGPMRLDEYMTTCLLHPLHGYYTTATPFGAAGDFITAPEISQMFGELIGLALAQVWLDQGRPERFTLAEYGPGRGTLMKDALRAASKVAGFEEAAQITLIELSPALRQAQRETLDGFAVTWIDTPETLPDQPLYLIANELLDALPIRQFIRDGDAWRERQVGRTNDALSFGLAPVTPQPMLESRLSDTQDGDLVEHCAGVEQVITPIATKIAKQGGVALIIDYGDWRTLGDSFQAVRGHASTDPLADPGQADLTAHVSFEAVAAAASPCAHTQLTPQGVFLERLGITARAQALAGQMAEEALATHIAAHRRLTHPGEMGNLFKVLGLYPPQAAPPPGLEPETTQ